MQDIFRHIDDHLDGWIGQLTELRKLPGVSAHPPTADAMAAPDEGIRIADFHRCAKAIAMLERFAEG